MKTIGEMIKIVQSLVPAAARTSTTSGETVVDTAGFDNVCWEVLTGLLTIAGGETYTCQVFESAASDGSGATAITGAATTVVAANTVKKIQVSGLGTGSRLRYQFLRVTMATGSPSWVGSAAAVLGESHGALNPTQAPDASV